MSHKCDVKILLHNVLNEVYFASERLLKGVKRPLLK